MCILCILSIFLLLDLTVRKHSNKVVVVVVVVVVSNEIIEASILIKIY
jgi:hypothetical protein